MRAWLSNVILAIKTVAQGMYITLWYLLQTFRCGPTPSDSNTPSCPSP